MPTRKTKKTAVTSNFLLNLANDIYNPKTRRFLRLCNGKLQNGPDPTDEERPMHCGLGELYFAMTGTQPEFDGVSEDDVVNLAVERSLFAGQADAKEKEAQASFRNAKSAIKKMKLRTSLELALIETVENEQVDYDELDDEDKRSPEEQEFRDLLDEIPSVNDENCGHNTCSFEAYRKRSQRVASKLRAAAKVLAEV